MARPLNVARPFASVVALSGARVLPAGPVAIAAVTVTPAWCTGLPLASWSCTAGCRPSATPLWAVVDGCVVSASVPAAAAVTLKVGLVPVSPDPATAVRV